MNSRRNHQHDAKSPKMRTGRIWKRLARSREGSAAIEFAILSIPYFMIIFAILETFIAFAAEQLVTNAVNTLGRQIRTGQITYGLNRSTDKTKEQFRQLFCDEVKILITCSATEVTTAAKLYIDARTFSTFAAIPTTIPRMTTATYSDINPATFAFTPGGPETINMLRAYYRWQVITDLVRPYITTIRPADGSMPSDFLIVATTAFKNEKYP
ncbi:pilus assembly protein [Rhizobium glycinendophyticum]|uniref:Pilus assembly protein n=2 Tax=Rhizobium glycinendophyticum TaxID=2589807 RepID=A0A504UF03_9HYPH|nr:pilus assembly protein [Rhizobium glycinendophyticum]